MFDKLFKDKGKWRRAKKARDTREVAALGPSIDDLIVLERYDEAQSQLQHRLKSHPNDLHSHLKLAEVYTAARKLDSAVDEYVYVAGEYARDGFYDKGLALLARAVKLRPLDENLKQKVSTFEQAKRLEQSRVAVFDGLRGEASDAQRQRMAVEMQRMWKNIIGANVIARLPDDQLTRLFGAMELIHVEKGTILVEEGSGLPQMALLSSGIVEAVGRMPDGAEVSIRNFGPGDMIGEGALLEHKAWPATYRVLERATLLTLTRQALEKALIGNPDPRHFLDVLRSQGCDREVALSLYRLRSKR